MCNVAMVLTGQNIYSVRAVQIMRSGRGGGGIGRQRDFKEIIDWMIKLKTLREMKRQSQKVDEGVLLASLVTQ